MNLDHNYPGTVYSLDLLAGFRTLSLDQGLDFRRISVFGADLRAFPTFQSLASNALVDEDFFGVRNRFYGGQIGAAVKMHIDTFTLTATFKCALGGTQERFDIHGQQGRSRPDGTLTTSPGGLFALPSNSGRFSRVEFSEVPEATVMGTWRVFDHLALRLGFSALYWHGLAFPGDQVDQGVNIAQIPSFPGAATAPAADPRRPQRTFAQSDLWLLGGQCGVEVVW
jgi:hypothetical protein